MTDKKLKAKILAEIERLRYDFPKIISQEEKDCQWLYWRGLNKIRDFINSLPEEPHQEFYDKLSKLRDDAFSNTTKESWEACLSEEPVKIDRQVSKMADEFSEREYEINGYERQWLSKGYYHGYMDALKEARIQPSKDI